MLAAGRDDLRVVGGDAPQRRALARVDGTQAPSRTLRESRRLTSTMTSVVPVEADGVDFAAGHAHVARRARGSRTPPRKLRGAILAGAALLASSKRLQRPRRSSPSASCASRTRAQFAR